MMTKDLTAKQGFTLIELLIGMAIIAILASIAIAFYLDFQLKAKTAEAKVNIGSIRICEEAYKVEVGGYRMCRPSPRSVNLLDPSKITWQDRGGFTDIGFDTKGSVYYSYSVIANDATNSFTVYAIGDLDGDGLYGVYKLTSGNSKITNDAKGEY